MNLEIVKLDEFGRGITYIDGKITFVPLTIPRDIVRVKLTKEKKNYNEAIVLEYVHFSPRRVDALCPYFGVCGGCSMQNISYMDEVTYKKDKVISYFKKNNLDINPDIIYDKEYNYRNKITLKVKDGVIGYYKENTHEIVEIRSCAIASDSINKVIPLLKSINIKNGSIIVRSNYKQELLLIVDSLDNLDFSDIFKSNFRGIILNGNLIYGDNYLEEVINNITYKITYDAFFQVNRLASSIFGIIEKSVNSKDIVLDLYSGVGTLALSASKNSNQVHGIEIVKNAVINARENAKINNIKNATFAVGDLDKISDNINFNKLIVDPPRSGLSEDVINMIKKKNPSSIIYVSCDYHTQVRDILELHNYEIVDSYIVDLFPRTYHTECILILERKNN